MSPTQPATRSPVALVTGGSRGIGKSIALALAERGADIMLTYRSGQSDAEAVSAQISALGRIAVALPLDLASVPSFEIFGAAVSSVLERAWQRSRFDYLVNNAGVGMAATSFAATTEAQFDELLHVHLKGTFFLTQRLLPLLSDGGRILNVSTGLARYTFPGFAAYAMMKGGVEVLTRYLASELGVRGITVNSIAPGGVETDFGGGAMRDQQLQRHVAAQTALGRVAGPADIGRLAAVLLASECGWVTGQRIEATGGFML